MAERTVLHRVVQNEARHSNHRVRHPRIHGAVQKSPDKSRHQIHPGRRHAGVLVPRALDCLNEGRQEADYLSQDPLAEKEQVSDSCGKRDR